MGGTGVATLVRTGVHCGADQAHLKPLGLGSSNLPHQPLAACPRGARNLRRQWTTAKPRAGDVSCNVLPFFLDLSLAFAPGVEFFDAVKSSVDSEVVFQATLQVPAHHALACRLNAYGTPFAAPDLQTAAHELKDEDLEFAACLATPPDLDEQLSVNFGRVMSMLEKNQGQGGAQIATRAAPARPAAGPSAVQQQLRATNQQAGQTAPKVLVSVDEAKTTAQQLQRLNSAKKQPKLLSLMDGYGKRAMQALLGLGYLLTILHEKSLGGRMEITAGITGASIISPSMSDKHIKPRTSGGLGVLAGLRSFMRECPSLSPLSPNNSINRRQTAASATAAAAAAAVAATDGSGIGRQQRSGDADSSTPRKLNMAASFEAAWDRVLHPPLSSSGMPAYQGLQLQLSLSVPCKRMSMDWSVTPGSTPCAPLSPATSHQQEQQGSGPLAASAAAGSASAPAATHRGSPLAQGSAGVMQANWQQQQDLKQNGLDQQQQQQQDEQLLQKMKDLGRDAGMDALLDDALQQLQKRQEASATDLVAMANADQSVFAQPPAQAAAGGVEDAAGASASPCTPVRPRPPLPPGQQQQQQVVSPGAGVRSFYLPDQGSLTSPLCPPSVTTLGGGVTVLKPPTPFGSPWRKAANGVSAAGKDGQSSAGDGSSISSSMPGTPQRMLLPVMSMRLTCQPSWQYSSSTAGAEGSTVAGGHTDGPANGVMANGVTQSKPSAAGEADVSKPSLTLAGFLAAADGAKQNNTSADGSRRSAVHMHQPTEAELRARTLAKQQQQLQQQQQGEEDEQLEEDDFDDSALMASPISCTLPQGLWPTMSFSLVPVRLDRLTPTSPRAQQHKAQQAVSNGACLA